MRDLFILAIVFIGGVTAIRKPWIGVMLWTWLSIMNPHRFTWGVAYDAPVAAFAAVTTLIGWLLTRDRSSPFKGAAPALLVLFMLWMTLSWLFGIDPDGDVEEYKKAIKVDIMILASLALLYSKKHIVALLWVSAGSLAVLGLKGGIFTLLTGGSYRVWGPVGSFIEDNNSFALALVMTIPLLRFLQLQLTNKWGRMAMTATMVACAAAAVGTYSRGALLGISAMLLTLWWRGKGKFWPGVLIVVGAVLAVTFMPDAWIHRMENITEYEQDDSSLGRISAWWVAWNLAPHYPFGVGFDAARPELFALYSPYPTRVHAAHSIYFQILGNHGYVGLALFLSIWIVTWRTAGWLRSHAKAIPQAAWCAELGTLCQVSLVGYAVGGAFLSLAYFDLPYNIMVVVLLARHWVQSRAWEREPKYEPGWKTIPGLVRPDPVGMKPV